MLKENWISKTGYNYQFNTNECEACGGHCCSGQSGYIYVDEVEIKKLVDFLGVDIQYFYKKYLIKNGYKFSLIEIQKEDHFNCVFFNEETKKCQVYDVRPNQCKTFPFWDYFKTNIKELQKECPAIKVNYEV